MVTTRKTKEWLHDGKFPLHSEACKRNTAANIKDRQTDTDMKLTDKID